MKKFVCNDYVVQKYEVLIDKKKLKSIRTDVINNCSGIVHYDYYGEEGPNRYDFLRIRNYKKYEENNNVYHFIYDEYLYPHLVTIIDGLLADKEEALDEILKTDLTLEQSTFEERKKELVFDIFFDEDIDYSLKNKLSTEYNALVASEELNTDRESILPYYSKVKDCIKFILVDAINQEKLNDVFKFFDVEDSVKEYAIKRFRK